MILDGIKELCRHTGLRPARIRALVRAGLPVRIIGRGAGRRYLADSGAVDLWIREPPSAPASRRTPLSRR